MADTIDVDDVEFYSSTQPTLYRTYGLSITIQAYKRYMNSKEYKVVYSFLHEFFRDEFYKIAIKNARNEIGVNPQYQLIWDRVKNIVHTKKLLNGERLSLVHHGANQVLDENSDDEAYIWLEKILSNIDRNDENINEY